MKNDHYKKDINATFNEEDQEDIANYASPEQQHIGILQNSSQKFSLTNNSNARKKPSLGVENHVEFVINKTEQAFTKLNKDVNNEKQKNNELNQYLEKLLDDKRKLQEKNQDLDSKLLILKEQNSSLVKQKNDHHKQLQDMKVELNNINNDWQLRKKQLITQLNQLKEEHLQLEQDKKREELAFQEHMHQEQNQINSLNKEINQIDAEIQKYQNLLENLKQKEKNSVEQVALKTQQFEQFLNNQLKNMNIDN